MGGEGPYVRFAHESFCPHGGSTIPPPPLDDSQLDEAYAGARAFLLERVRQLVQLGWEKDETDDTLLASLHYTRVLNTYSGDRQSLVELRLPHTANAWFDPSLVPRWRSMFEKDELFNPRRRRGRDSTSDRYADAYLFVDVEAPLRDIFNFIQCLVPDMLIIIRIDDIDDIGDHAAPSFVQVGGGPCHGAFLDIWKRDVRKRGTGFAKVLVPFANDNLLHE